MEKPQRMIVQAVGDRPGLRFRVRYDPDFDDREFAYLLHFYAQTCNVTAETVTEAVAPSDRGWTVTVRLSPLGGGSSNETAASGDGNGTGSVGFERPLQHAVLSAGSSLKVEVDCEPGLVNGFGSLRGEVEVTCRGGDGLVFDPSSFDSDRSVCSLPPKEAKSLRGRSPTGREGSGAQH
mmetsp:Transcript_7580/g.14784  ORF Transcript_7580/g.14784 Transcript_7580/m.14784 type:complete len:179 (+) Transcript_7580:1441-1977(+)